MNKKPLKSWDTKVSIARSQESIRDLLSRFGVSKATFEEDFKTGTQILRFEHQINDKTIPVQFRIEIKGIYEWLLNNGRSSWNNDYRMKQAKKIAWRHIADWIKVNLNLIEFGLIPFENMFLSYFARVLPDGSYQTLGEHTIPRLENFNKLLPEPENKEG